MALSSLVARAHPLVVSAVFTLLAAALPPAVGQAHTAPSALPGGPTAPAEANAANARARRLFSMYCARCHGNDASASHPPADLRTRPFNFRRCDVASADPISEWILAITRGGSAVGRSAEMPAFEAQLSADEILALARHLRGLCTEGGWPDGDLNFPRPLLVEKAFPEDEVVFAPAVSHGNAGRSELRLDATVEKRLGKRSMVEVGVPGATSWGEGGRHSGSGDLSLAFKHVVLADRQGSDILSAGLELTFPTAQGTSDLGHGSTVYEGFLAGGLRRGPTYLQAMLSLELPSRQTWRDREVGYGLYLGRDLSDEPRKWTIGVELTGENRSLGVTPQIRKGLSRTGALSLGAGVHLPLNERSEARYQWLGYLVWDFREPIRR